MTKPSRRPFALLPAGLCALAGALLALGCQPADDLPKSAPSAAADPAPPAQAPDDEDARPGPAGKPRPPFDITWKETRATGAELVSAPFHLKIETRNDYAAAFRLNTSGFVFGKDSSFDRFHNVRNAGGPGVGGVGDPGTKAKGTNTKGASEPFTGGMLAAVSGTEGYLAGVAVTDTPDGKRTVPYTFPFTASRDAVWIGTPRPTRDDEPNDVLNIRASHGKAVVQQGYVGTLEYTVGTRPTAGGPDKTAKLALTVLTRGAVTPLFDSKDGGHKILAAAAARETQAVKFAIPRGQRGLIAVEVGPAGRIPGTGTGVVARRVYYLYAHERKLYTSASGFLDLDLKVLDDDLAAGKVSPGEYQKRLDEVLGGGAEETITPARKIDRAKN
ncbi:hypothetical protein [Fimbriiglobus ruber]|uniref:Lipoprotein n=1 Tax=Fimbriiglobus ruber TaxID=1908690 RepID=A0A225DWQ8_9BACT|nr:hypothetical protein [Fimbriiglobus ruber]OWK45822.1 hypothetical protein FRUB_02153 [Fimbriiglobus ruber]